MGDRKGVGMALLNVARLGRAVLVTKAEPLSVAELRTTEVQRLIDDMLETMRDAPGVGLAAPQVHRSLRLFVMDPGRARDGEEGGGPRVVVNPVLTFPDEERLTLWEGCLSIPGVRGRTERHATVEVEYLDREGRPQQVRFHGLPSVVAQHETDHLDGILFFQRMPDLSLLAFEDELERADSVARSTDEGEDAVDEDAAGEETADEDGDDRDARGA
jgi:peptide deformylase